METIYKNRFLALYNHMIQPQRKLGHKKFDFNHFNDGLDICGTMGCMAGELPILYPDEWLFDGIFVRLTHGEMMRVADDLTEFFNIPIDEVYHLFYPWSQNSKIYPYFLKHSELSVHILHIF